MTKKLAIFDFDGTIAESTKIPPEIICGFKNLRKQGYITTISTGRGYVRIKEALGEDYNELVSSDALLIVEHGTKIVDHDGKVIFSADFDQTEVDHIADFARANIELFRLGWFNPSISGQKVQVWCIDESEIDTEIEYRGHYADVFTGSVTEFKEAMEKQKLSNVSFRLKPHITVENLKLRFTRTSVDVVFQDGNMEFIKSNMNKSIAVSYLLSNFNLSHSDLLVAGNAINDVEMLNIDASLRILVGTGNTSDNVMSYLSEHGSIVRVETPVELGLYLADFLNSIPKVST